MTEKELYKLFEQDCLHMEIDQKKKEQSLLLLDQAIDHKKIVPMASSYEIIKKQLQFLDHKILILQGMCLLLLLPLCGFLRNTGNEEFSYILMTSSAPVFSMLMVLGCRREEAYGIAELTGSCFFHYRQICALRMILYGTTNLFLMTGLSIVLHTNMQRSVLEAGIYFLVPFLMTGCVQFTILLTGLGRRNNYSLIAAGLFMTAGWTGAASFPGIYEPAALAVWTAVLFFCIVCYGIETAAVLKQIERGDLLCTN